MALQPRRFPGVPQRVLRLPPAREFVDRSPVHLLFEMGRVCVVIVKPKQVPYHDGIVSLVMGVNVADTNQDGTTIPLSMKMQMSPSAKAIPMFLARESRNPRSG